MAKRKARTPWDKWSFNIAWILAVLLALGSSFGLEFTSYAWWSIILVILGLIVGFMHDLKDVTALVLLAVAVAIFTGSSLAAIPYIGSFIANAISQFITFLTPAALVVSLRKVYEILGR
jgi:hypothetical protein